MATITGDAGNNRLNGTPLADLISGLDGDDTLSGLAGDDTLQGGVGNDWLRGGAGNDRLDGGDGVDTALYDTETANLTVDLDNSVHFDGNPGNDDTLWSVERIWTGSGNDLIFCTRDLNHEIYAGAGDDTLRGFTFNDTLIGGSGNDSLDGSLNDDVLWGGPGIDTLDGGQGRDLATYADETGALLVDMAAATVAFPVSGATTEHLVSIEGVLTGSGDDTLLGSASADDLRAGAGADLLRGACGDDTLDGGIGRDTILGGVGSDTVRYASHGRGMTIDLSHQVAWTHGSSAFTDVLRSIENAIGGQGGDRLIGSAIGQSLDGGAGDDTLLGLGGDDTLTGAAGRDRIEGGDGNDTFIGAHFPYDSAFYDSDPNYLDRFYAGLADDGRDTIVGGAGSDTVVVPNAYFQGFQEPTEWLVNAKVDLIARTLRVDLAGATTDRLYSIENVTTGGGDDIVQGDGAANRISVGDGLNVVHGAGGDDTLIGGGIYADHREQPQDQLYGEAGNDLIIGNGSVYDNYYEVEEATDLLNGGSGNDTLVGGVWRTVMWGGFGADQFQSSNAIGTIESADSYYYVGEHATIRDFDPTEGDVIAIRVVNNPDHVTPTFVGQVADLDQLGDFELGYVRQGSSTVLQFGPDSVDTEDALHIQLAGYSGPLASDDFAFI